MSTPQIIAKVKCLAGHSFNYQGQAFKLEDWHMQGDHLHIETDQEGTDIKVHVAHAAEFFDELAPMNRQAEMALEGKAVAPTAGAAAALTNSNAVMQMLPNNALATMNEALLASIAQVQKDPAFIAQARAISETVQVAVNVAKLQIDAGKLMLQAQRSKK
jgi:hypothetical protein